jgi:hypothetical protein
VFVSKNQTKVTYPPSTTRARDRFPPAMFPLFALPTRQDYQPHPLVPSLAASTFPFGALSWRYPEFKILNFKLGHYRGIKNRLSMTLITLILWKRHYDLKFVMYNVRLNTIFFSHLLVCFLRHWSLLAMSKKFL